MTQIRAKARDEVAKAIFEIQGQIQNALVGSTLRGLGNLTPEPNSEPFLAARMRGKYLFDPLPHDGRPLLVLLPQGQIVMARRALDQYDGKRLYVSCRAATADDLVAQDVVDVVHNLERVLMLHIEKCDQSAHKYEHFCKIADKINRAFST